MLDGVKIGCVMTGSFCTFKSAFDMWRGLAEMGAELYPIMSYNAYELDNRFYTAEAARALFEGVAGRKVWHSIPEVEPIGPKKLLDVLAVAPCTGNTLSKISLGITDTPAALAVKSHLRNAKPVVIAVSTNDALGINARNIGSLLCMKHIYFVPMRQDDFEGKPNSLVADFGMTAKAIERALLGEQLQPLLL